jgi:diguanylate cyclase (GGDEF)-like protein
LGTLARAFVVHRRDELTAARAALDVFLASGDREALTRLRGLFHTIAGAGASVGYRALGTVASLAEDVATLLLDEQLAVTDETKGIIERGFVELETSFNEASEGPVRAAPEPSPQEVAKIEGAGVRTRVVIIDDDPLSARIIGRCLHNAGMQSTHCRDPLRAIEVIEQEMPDLVLLDLLMPGQDGFDTCRQIRAKFPADRLPIIFITRLSQVDEKVRALRDGADDYITKPFEPNELVARVRLHVQRLTFQREQAIRDGLTDAYNHRYLKQRLAQEVNRAQQSGQPLSLAVIDVDHFKRVNERQGHEAGDTLLQGLVQRIAGSLRRTDVIARHGGDELSLVLIGMSADEAARTATRLVEAIRRDPFEVQKGQSLSVTISAGVAQLQSGETMEQLWEHAEAAIHSAKRDGGNRLALYAPAEPLARRA